MFRERHSFVEYYLQRNRPSGENRRSRRRPQEPASSSRQLADELNIEDFGATIRVGSAVSSLVNYDAFWHADADDAIIGKCPITRKHQQGYAITHARLEHAQIFKDLSSRHIARRLAIVCMEISTCLASVLVNHASQK